MKENELITMKEARNNLMGREDVFDDTRVKALSSFLLPKDFGATTQMVADYFEVDKATIEYHIYTNKEHEKELKENGLHLEFKDNLLTLSNQVKTKRGGFDILDEDGRVVGTGSNKGIMLFTRRSILNLAMMLEGSEVAKQIRTVLLDDMKESSENGKRIIEAIETVEFQGNINNLVYSKDGEAITTSKIISNFTGKRHDHILRDIREEIAQLQTIHSPNLGNDVQKIIDDFKETTYIAENGQMYTQYELGEMATMQLMLKYSTEYRAKFILSFQKMRIAINNMFKAKVIESVLPQDNRNRQYIYVIKNPLNETVKIGVAQDVEKRIKQLETRAGIQLELIYKSMICSNAFSIERDVHKHFEEYRTFGEWFKINPSTVINFLEQQTFVLKSEFMKYLPIYK